MSLKLSIVSTANRMLKFDQSDETAIRDFLDTLRMSGQLFTNKSLIVATPTETQIISPSSLTRIEVETELDLDAYVPQLKDTPLTLIKDAATAPPPQVSDTFVSLQLNCFFEGGDICTVWLSGPRPNRTSERLMRLTRLFEQPVMVYKLPGGGVGFMNPARMIRAQFAAESDVLPPSAWRLNSAN